jgi:pentatricopeptide repeat protein
MVKMMVHGAEGVETRTSNVNLGDAYQHKGLLFKNCEGQLGEMNVRKRREWHSNTGRKLLTKKHGERISSMLEALEQNSNIKEALLWHGKLKVKEQSILLNAQQRWDKALVLYSWLKAQDYYKPNVYHYNILFRIFGRAGKWDLVQDLWAEMKTEKISATNVTFSTLIDGYAKSWRKEDAIVCFESMKQSGLQPDEVTINTLINAYKRFGDPESGKKLFRSLSFMDPTADNNLETAVMPEYKTGSEAESNPYLHSS